MAYLIWHGWKVWVTLYNNVQLEVIYKWLVNDDHLQNLHKQLINDMLKCFACFVNSFTSNLQVIS